MNDLPEIVTIHQEAFANFFLTRLGPDFLLKYYTLVLRYPAGIMLVSEGRRTLNGFACGFVDAGSFYRHMWDTKWAFLQPLFSAVLRQPILVNKVISGIHRMQAPASDWPPGSCELSSIAVLPEASGNGLGKALIRAFLAEARRMDADCVYLTTDADGNDAVNALYRGIGFRHKRCFLQSQDRWMNEYFIADSKAERGRQ